MPSAVRNASPPLVEPSCNMAYGEHSSSNVIKSLTTSAATRDRAINSETNQITSTRRVRNRAWSSCVLDGRVLAGYQARGARLARRSAAPRRRRSPSSCAIEPNQRAGEIWLSTRRRKNDWCVIVSLSRCTPSESIVRRLRQTKPETNKSANEEIHNDVTISRTDRAASR